MLNKIILLSALLAAHTTLYANPNDPTRGYCQTIDPSVCGWGPSPYSRGSGGTRTVHIIHKTTYTAPTLVVMTDGNGKLVWKKDTYYSDYNGFPASAHKTVRELAETDCNYLWSGEGYKEGCKAINSVILEGCIAAAESSIKYYTEAQQTCKQAETVVMNRCRKTDKEPKSCSLIESRSVP